MSLTISRSRLITLAGLVWLAIGLMLIGMALFWYRNSPDALLFGIFVGVLFGPALSRLKVSRLALANLERIRTLAPERRELPVIEFQSRRAYAIVLLMMVMGATLRQLAIPREYIAPVYLVMGLALVLASRVYFRVQA